MKAWAARHGRWITLKPSDVERTDRWFYRHCSQTVLIGRLIPTTRTIISVPAGIFGMSLTRFLLFTGIGSALWTGALAGAGYKLGGNPDVVGRYLNPATNIVFAIVVAIYLTG